MEKVKREKYYGINNITTVLNKEKSLFISAGRDTAHWQTLASISIIPKQRKQRLLKKSIHLVTVYRITDNRMPNSN